MSPEVTAKSPRRIIRRLLRRPYQVFSGWLFDPIAMVKRWRGVPYFFRNVRAYASMNRDERFRVRFADVWYRSFDRFDDAGALTYHYFHQDLWAAKRLYEENVRAHVDVGSRVDGFIAHILAFCHVTYVDIRPLNDRIDNFEFRQGSITDMPFADGSVPSLSCLHVIEHIGLGRYGDPVDPDGYRRAARELVRVLAAGGRLLLGTPVGRERVCFDAHRVFDPATIVDVFAGLELEEFLLIDDKGLGVVPDPTFERARACEYGCGLFEFRKATA